MTAVYTGLDIREARSVELDQWDDLVRRFANYRVTHTRAWIESLEASGHGKALYLLFEKDGEVVACLPGLLVTVGKWRLFGSPMPGWQTVSLGPVFDPDMITTAEIMSVLVPFLEERHGVAHIEFLHTGLDADAMRASGFEGEAVVTHVAPLFPGDEQQAFRGMKDSARRNVRRAERLGLVVRVEEDESFVDEHYAQLVQVYQRNGTVIPFSKTRILSCFRSMKASGNLLALSVYLPGGRVNIATGMFFIEGRELCLWMWTHRDRYRWYRGTELMTWTAMQRAMAAGCDRFDLMGGGEFKTKLGAEPDLTKWRWRRSSSSGLALARGIAGRAFTWQQVVRGRAARLADGIAATITPRAIATRRRDSATAWVMGDIDLVRALGLAGIRSTVIASPGAASRFSRFTRDTLDRVPGDDMEALVERMAAHAETLPEPPVLFYQDDASMLMVSRYRDRLHQAFRFIVPDAALVENLADKARFQALARRLKLPVPSAWVLSAGDALPTDALAATYPILVKPINRQLDGWGPLSGGGKAISVGSPEELAAAWSRLSASGVSVMVQTMVPGPESAIESYHVYTDERGAVVAEFTGRKIRTYPVAFGDSSALEITDAADVAALGRDIVRTLKLKGVAKLDFKRAPDGVLHLLEVNPRFTLWNHLGAVAGVNIPALVHGDLLGHPRPEVSVARAGTQWCKVWTDRLAARSTGVPFLSWLTWASRCESKSAFAWDDPLPLVRAGLWQRLHGASASHAPTQNTAPVAGHSAPRASTAAGGRATRAGEDSPQKALLRDPLVVSTPKAVGAPSVLAATHHSAPLPLGEERGVTPL